MGTRISHRHRIWVNIFQQFFESFKIDPEVVDALVDWIDTGDNPRSGPVAQKNRTIQSLPIPYVPPNKHMRTPGELRLVKGLNDLETLAKLFPGATPEAVADLDLGSNNYLTPFGAEQTQTGTQTGTPSGTRQARSRYADGRNGTHASCHAGRPIRQGEREYRFCGGAQSPHCWRAARQSVTAEASWRKSLINGRRNSSKT